VDISPIGDLTKTEVYALSEALGIVRSIREAVPTDGLFGDDRSDEEQIGATYPELEWAMEQAGAGVRAEDLTGRQREVFDIFIRRHRANLHKMEMPPVFRITR
jgi:NAD+ synthase